MLDASYISGQPEPAAFTAPISHWRHKLDDDSGREALLTFFFLDFKAHVGLWIIGLI